jgi:hypothetical protein
VRRLVAGFAPTITPHFYDGYPLPAYTFDKINIGLIDAHALAADPQALAILNLATDAALPHLPERALTRPEMAARPHPNMAFTWDESYTLPENVLASELHHHDLNAANTRSAPQEVKPSAHGGASLPEVNCRRRFGRFPGMYSSPNLRNGVAGVHSNSRGELEFRHDK